MLLNTLLFVIAIATGWVWFWRVQHEADVRRCWQAFVQHLRVADLREQLTP
jgi:uncharacterized membrane protein